MMKKSLALLTLMVLVYSCNKEGGSSAKIETEEQKTLYTLGTMFGGRLSQLELTDDELSAVAQGMKDSAKGTKLLVDDPEYQKKVQDLFRTRMEKVSAKLKTSGTEFIEKFVKDEGAQKTASGLAYKITEAGSAKKPKEDETVEVHYHGTLTDGTVFDSSKERGKTVSFPLNRVIKGWTEGLQLIGEGGKIKLVIPSELAYGDAGAPPKIPGGSTLVFDVELVKIEGKQAEASAAPAPKAAPAKKKN
jgi:FKBP-type peptidyl-prolyl cis-trans isomerase FkpA